MKKKVLIGAGMVALAAFLAYVPFAFADRTMMHRDGMMGGGPGMHSSATSAISSRTST